MSGEDDDALDVDSDGEDETETETESGQLEPDERVLATLHATYSNHASGHIDALRQSKGADVSLPPPGRPFGRGGQRRRVTGIGRYLQWKHNADVAGFPVAGMAMHLRLTDRRLQVFGATFVRGRPRGYVGSLALTKISQLTVQRAMFGTRLVFLMQDGQLVSIEAGSARKSRQFATALRDALDRRSRPSK